MLQRLSVRGKLLVVVVIPAATLAALAVTSVKDRAKSASQMARLRNTVAVAESAGGLLYESQKERGMSAGYLGSKGQQFADAIRVQRQNFDNAVAAMKPVLSQADPDTELGRQLSKIDEYLARVPKMRAQITEQAAKVGEAVQFFTGLNRKLLAVVDMVARDAARPDVSAMATALGAVMRVTEYGGIERAVLANTYARGAFGPGMWDKLQALIALQKENQEIFEAYASPVLKTAWADRLGDDVVAPTEQMRTAALASKGTEPVEGFTATDWFGAQTKKLDRLRAVQILATERIQQTAEQYRAEATTSLFGLVAVVGLAQFATLLLAWVLVSRITKPLAALASVMTEVEETAEFNKRVTTHGDDELAQAGRAFNGLLDQLEATIDDVEQMCTAMGRGKLNVSPRVDARGRFCVIADGLSNVQRIVHNVMSEVSVTVERLESTVQQLSGSSTSLASNAEELSAVTTTSMAATEETDAMVAANTESAQKANERINTASDRADAGRSKMDELQSSINAIAEMSRELSEAISSIDAIAFQTSILAVNAAIEAAQAGRHGRGFAVVAQEVQNLAERSAQAAKESTTHLEATRASVQKGLRVAEETNEAFTAITGEVDQVRGQLEEIVHASREQRVGVSELSRSMQEINTSASLLRSESGGLSGQAGTLTSMTEALREALAVFELAGHPASVAAESRPNGTAPSASFDASSSAVEARRTV